MFLAEDDDLAMHAVPTDEAATDPVAASVEEARDSGVDPDSSPGITSFFFFFTLPLSFVTTDIFVLFAS